MKRTANLILLIILCSIVYAQSGPGGVGNSSYLGLWLRADQGFSVINSETHWNDLSGNNNNAWMDGNQQPLLQPSVPAYNLQDAISFSTNKMLEVNDDNTLDPDKMSLFVVGEYDNNNSKASFLAKTTNSTWTDGWGVSRENGNAAVNFWANDINNYAPSVSCSENVASIFTGEYDASVVAISKDGNTPQSINVSGPILANSGKLLIGNAPGTLNYLDGKIAEIIMFNQKLNAAERIIVQNYLSSRYDIALGSNDYYSHDKPEPYYHDVIGIGRKNNNATHYESIGMGIVEISNPTDPDNGEYFFIGHNGAGLSSQIADVPQIYNGIPVRMQRVWRVDKTDLNGNDGIGKVDLSFDLSGSGFIYAEDHYELMIDSDGDFDVGNNYRRHIIGRDLDQNDVLSFNAVDLKDGDYFTLVAGDAYELPECPCGDLDMNGDYDYSGSDDQCFGAPYSGTVNYRDPIVNMSYKVKEDVTYSSAPEFGEDINGIYQDLKMDIYTPCNTQTERPTILICDGGGFNTNNKCNKDVQYLAKQLVSRGYVVATFSYRSYVGTQKQIEMCSINTGYSQQSCTNNYGSVNMSSSNCMRFRDYVTTLTLPEATKAWQEMNYKNTQDGRAAIRYLKHKKLEYKIDDELMFMSGISAGGALTLHTLYYNEADNPPPFLNQDFGDFDATADNAISNSVTAEIQGGISLWGVMAEKTYMDIGEPPVEFIHGTWDLASHFQKRDVYGGTAYGAESLAEYANQLSGGPSYKIWSICEAKHGIRALESSCGDDVGGEDINHTRMMHMVDFLYDIQNSQLPSAEVNYNSVHDFITPSFIQGDVTNLCPTLTTNGLSNENHCPTTIGDLEFKARKKSQTVVQQVLEGKDFDLYPNPNSGIFTMSYKGSVAENSLVKIYSIGGKLIKSVELKLPKQQLDLSKLNGGIYLIEYEGQFKKLVLNK